MSGGEQGARRPRWTGTWLGGARAAGVDLGYPGERLGLPEHGSGSVAGYGRRLLALLLDFLVASVIAAALAQTFGWEGLVRSWASTGIFALESFLLTATIGMTVGKRLCGIRTVRLDGRPVGFGWALARTVLILTVVPALFWDRDYRGLHDRAANTVVIRL